MTDYSEIQKLAKHHINLHGTDWNGEESAALESIPTFSAEMFIAAASPLAVLGLIAMYEANRHEREVVCANYDQLKAECEGLRKTLTDVRDAVQREYWDEYAGLDDTRAILDAALGKEASNG